MDNNTKEQILDYFKNNEKEEFRGNFNDLDEFSNILSNNGIYFENNKFYHDGKTAIKTRHYFKYDENELLNARFCDYLSNSVFFTILIYNNEEQQQKARENIYNTIIQKPLFEISLKDLEFLEKNNHEKYLYIIKLLGK